MAIKLHIWETEDQRNFGGFFEYLILISGLILLPFYKYFQDSVFLENNQNMTTYQKFIQLNLTFIFPFRQKMAYLNKIKISSSKSLNQSKIIFFLCRRGQWELSWLISLLLCRQQLPSHLTVMSEAFGRCKSFGWRDKEPSRQTTDRPENLCEHSLNGFFQKTPFFGAEKRKKSYTFVSCSVLLWEK